ncbi:unnamed protein product, partial [Allacma fusca]
LNGLDIDLNISEVLSPGGTTSMRNRKASESESSATLPLAETHFPEVPEKSGGFVDNFSDSSDSTENFYAKLKHFITLSEQTQEITLDVETKIKDFERENREFLSILNVKHENK